MESHAGGNPSQPALIADALSKSFGLTQAAEDLRELSEGSERIANIQPKIDTLLDRFATLREMCESRKSVLEACDRFAIGRPCGGLRPGLTAVRDSLVPHLARESVVSETIGLLGGPGRIQLFDRRYDPSVNRAPSVPAEPRVNDVLIQARLESKL